MIDISRRISLILAVLIVALACDGLDEHDPDMPWTPVPVQEGVPVVDVVVDGGEESVSRDDDLRAVMVISENGKPVVSSQGKIKGRGNYTWN